MRVVWYGIKNGKTGELRFRYYFKIPAKTKAFGKINEENYSPKESLGFHRDFVIFPWLCFGLN
jgi:hypothetical protein